VIKMFRSNDNENIELMKIFAFYPVVQHYWKEGFRILMGSGLMFSIEDYSFAHVHPAGALANEITSLWNQRGVTKKIRVHSTFIWQKHCRKNKNKSKSPIKSSRNCGDEDTVQHVFVERYFDRYFIWNSNSGWSDSKTKWGLVMQGLSHFSYHVSCGKLLICDLQGGFHRDREPDTGPFLVSPAFCSVKNNLGITDLGIRGIHAFFYRHKCNEYCSKEWIRPSRNSEKGKKYAKRIKESKSTTYWDVQKKEYI